MTKQEVEKIIQKILAKDPDFDDVEIEILATPKKARQKQDEYSKLYARAQEVSKYTKKTKQHDP